MARKKKKEEVKKDEPVVYKGYFVENIREYGPNHPHYFMVEEYDSQK